MLYHGFWQCKFVLKKTTIVMNIMWSVLIIKGLYYQLKIDPIDNINSSSI